MHSSHPVTSLQLTVGCLILTTFYKPFYNLHCCLKWLYCLVKERDPALSPSNNDFSCWSASGSTAPKPLLNSFYLCESSILQDPQTEKTCKSEEQIAWQMLLRFFRPMNDDQCFNQLYLTLSNWFAPFSPSPYFLICYLWLAAVTLVVQLEEGLAWMLLSCSSEKSVILF